MAGAEIGAEELHDELTTGEGGGIFSGGHGRDAVGPHRRDAEEFHDGGHGVGRELPAARACPWTGAVFNRFQLCVVHLAGGVFPHGLEDIGDGDIPLGVAAGRDRAAIQHEAGNVQTRERHHHAGVGFITATEADDGIEVIAARYQFDRVGDDFAADERGLHAFRAHGDAVVDGDGVEFKGRTACGANAFFDFGGQPAQMEIARADFGPRVGDAHKGLTHVSIVVAHGFEHAARRGAAGTIGYGRGVFFKIGHGEFWILDFGFRLPMGNPKSAI